VVAAEGNLFYPMVHIFEKDEKLAEVLLFHNYLLCIQLFQVVSTSILEWMVCFR
jgi:hypothetical protein